MKKSQGKLKQFNGNTADLILLKGGTNMWVHCDLNEFIMLNEQMEEELKPLLDLTFCISFVRKSLFFREKSGSVAAMCTSHVFLSTNEIIIFSSIFPLNIQLFTTLYSGK